MYIDSEKKITDSFNVEQFVSSTEVVRNFSDVRSRSKKNPLLILDKNSPDSVLLSIEDYNYFIKTVEQLKEKIFDMKIIEKVREMETDGYKTVPFSKIKTDRISEAMIEVDGWDIADEELFE